MIIKVDMSIPCKSTEEKTWHLRQTRPCVENKMKVILMLMKLSITLLFYNVNTNYNFFLKYRLHMGIINGILFIFNVKENWMLLCYTKRNDGGIRKWERWHILKIILILSKGKHVI